MATLRALETPRQSRPFVWTEIYEDVLFEVCISVDPTRPYRQSTPYGGADYSCKQEDDRHNWDVRSKKVDYSGYLEDRGRFISDFGWQGPATLETLQAHLSSELTLDAPDFVCMKNR